MTSVIVACCSKAGLAVIRGLGEHGIPILAVCFGDNQIGAASRFVHDRRYTCDPSEDEDGFINDLLDLDSRWSGAALIPTDDSSLVAISRHRPTLESRYRVVCEPWNTVRNVIEKHRTYAIAKQHGIECPRLRIARSAQQALRFAREIGFPCLLKPSVGHLFFKQFRRKMLMVHSEAELLQQMPGLMGYGGHLMVCEYIPGGDECGINYNSFAIAGTPIAEFTAVKIRNKPQLIGFPTAVRSVSLPEVKTPGRSMLRALGLNDFSCMEFKRDPRDGICKLMEVNARHNYSGALAIACGMNFPLLSFRRAMHQPLATPDSQPLADVCWIDEERDMRDVLRSLLRGRKEVASALEPYLARKVFAVFRSDDPGPSLALMKASISFALRRRRKRVPRNPVAALNRKAISK